jgi:site-specific DNA-methyltransferase (adenine-specific)
MTAQAAFALRCRNPDVLTCIANLSNDEVFTPPELATRMLNTLAEAWAADYGGANLWADKTVRFLDPCTKSGVFLREITSRLNKGLTDEIPDLQERVNHILTKQVFGIGITHLTSLLARRSVYCSKHANGRHSIAKGFARDDGNIWFERTEHAWVDGKCTFCGASQSILDRGEELETHAYAFIHTTDVKNRVAAAFGGEMQFDLIIGNPPYQLSDGGYGTSAAPIYHQFVEKALELDPRYAVFVTPSRWMTGGNSLHKYIDIATETVADVGVNVGVSDRILELLRREPGLSAKELATLLNRTTRTIERRIKELREQGRLRRIGSDKAGHWEVVEK